MPIYGADFPSARRQFRSIERGLGADGLPNTATAILAITFGLIAVAFGVRAYMGRGAEGTARHLSIFLPLVYVELPGGCGFTLVGIGLLIARHPISDFLILAGLALIAVGMLLIFWHPNWIRPTWLRDGLGD